MAVPLDCEHTCYWIYGAAGTRVAERMSDKDPISAKAPIDNGMKTQHAVGDPRLYSN